MMMPANFTAVNSEVVYGGADLFSILADTTAPIWNAANVKQFNTNLITLVSNSFFQKTVNSTLGVMFGGNWGGEGANSSIFGGDGILSNVVKYGSTSAGTKEINGFNKFMQVVGLSAAVYQLGTSSAKTYVGETKVMKNV